MTKLQISKALDTKECRIALAEVMILDIQRSMELKSFGFVPPKTKKQIAKQKYLEKCLKYIVDNQVDAPAGLHEEISLRSWDFI